MSPIPLKKIAVKEVMETPKGQNLAIPEAGAHVQLFVVYGVVTASIKKPSKHDPNQMLLMGRFKAVRASDRKEFSAEQLYLPDRDYQNQLAAANCPDRSTGEVNEISVAYNIGYKAGASPTGYVFTCQPVIDYKVQDALADVEKQINFDKVLPALAAPASGSESSGGKNKTK